MEFKVLYSFVRNHSVYELLEKKHAELQVQSFIPIAADASSWKPTNGPSIQAVI
jgi:hypothetical protein